MTGASVRAPDAARRRRGPGARRGLPISLRLSALFAALFLVGLLVSSGVAYLQLGRTIRSGIDASLVAASEEIIEDMPQATDADERQVGSVTSTEVESQILDRNGDVLDSSTDELAGRPLLTDAQVSRVIRGEELFTDSSLADEPTRVLATPVTGDEDAAILVVAAELDPLEEFRRAYLEAALPLMGIAVILAGLAGWLLSRRALRPVAQMTRDADEIGETNLQHRLAMPRSEDELGRLATTLNALLDRLEQAVQRERDFTADACHELRTPLAILRAELEVALDRTTDDAVRDSLRSALEECRRLEGLTDDLLLIARAEADQHGGRVPVDLGDLSDRVLGRFHTVASQRNITLTRTGEAVVSGDPRALERALSNLVDNALRSVAEDGHVDIHVEATDATVLWSVHDDGAGVTDAAAHQLLDRFARAEQAHPGGAGLGLAIVAAVSKLHHGDVQLENSQGRGLRVTIRLPNR